MSFKAYLFKIESSRDAIVLRDYLKDMGDAAWLSFFYHVDEQIDDTKFAPGDIVAAMTVDRGDVIESFVVETQVCKLEDVPYHLRLDNLITSNRLVKEAEGYRVKGMTVADEFELDDLCVTAPFIVNAFNEINDLFETRR